ncbi:hypothetical protein BLOT_006861 [Blomia tropicalis]|nr:hypothetical protein BLOT_006861 [Blomia tropicalis]
MNKLRSKWNHISTRLENHFLDISTRYVDDKSSWEENKRMKGKNLQFGCKFNEFSMTSTE